MAAAPIIRQEGWGDQVERLKKPVAINPAYLVFAKRLHKQQVLERFDQALAKMKEDGSYDRLVQDFVANDPERKTHKE